MPILLWQEPLPPPKVDAGIDVGMGDYELFQKFVLPNGGLCLLGDMWPDAPRRINDYLMIFFWIAYSNTSISIVGTIDTPVEGRIRPSSLLLSAQAHLDDCLNYLGGCKYLDPPGRWESCQLMAR